MSESDKAASVGEGAVPPVAPESAGSLLRRARQAQGLELDQLAQLLKVPVRKLAALESDRFEELPGNAFVRGLAMSVARQLGLDPQVILAALPQSVPAPAALESVSRGLATPYREPEGRVNLGGVPEWLRPGVLLPAALLLGALLFWLAPPMRTLFSAVSGGAVATADETPGQAVSVASTGVDLGLAAASAVALGAASATAVVLASSAPLLGPPAIAGMASAVVDTVHSAPQSDVAASAQNAAAAAAAAGSVVLRTSAESWVEVRDAAGVVLLSRMLLPGEVVGLDGAMPMKLKIGNADGTRVSLRGQQVELQPFTRDNVARLDLK